MKTRFLYSTIALLTFFLTVGCQDDLDITITETELDPPLITEGTATLYGDFLSTFNTPDGFASLQVNVPNVGPADVTTVGQFFQQGIPIPVAGLGLTATRVNLAPERRFLMPTDGTVQYGSIKLEGLSRSNISSIEGGAATGRDEGLTLNVLPGSVLADGILYDGDFEVRMSYDAPDDFQEVLQSHANFPGKHPERGSVVLENLGTAYVELNHPEGKTITFAPQLPAKITLPPANINQIVLRDSVLLWRLKSNEFVYAGFSEADEPDAISFPLTEAGFVMAGVPYSRTEFSIRLVTADNVPAAGLPYDIQLPEGNSVFSFWSDSDGIIHAPVPKNEVLVLKVVDPCTGEFDSDILIGPFTDGENVVENGAVDYQITQQALRVELCPFMQGDHENYTVYVNGYPDRGIVRLGSDGLPRLITYQCGEEETGFVQVVHTRRGATSPGLYQNELAGLNELEVCDELAEEQFIEVTQLGRTYDSWRGDYLRTRDDANRYRHLFRGSIVSSGLEELGGRFELELPTGGVGTYEFPDVTISLSFSSVASFTALPCINNCEDLEIRILEVGPNESWYAGDFSYTANADPFGGPIDPMPIPVTGSFRLNR